MLSTSLPLFIGLISGTSIDGIDTVLVSIDENRNKVDIIANHLEEIPSDLRKKTLQISLKQVEENFIEVAKLDVIFGHLFAKSVNHLLNKAKIKAHQVSAIGSHGQTLWHHPHPPIPFTVQIGDPNIIAKKTNIITIGDFRRADLALGGQGAPFVPPFHLWLFGTKKARTIVNVGGIANITLIDPSRDPSYLGFDTGPGNGLMDAFIQQHLGKNFDQNGDFAKAGNCCLPLLNLLLNDNYFKQKGPKSTGKDYFNLKWLNRYLIDFSLTPQDIQATLLQLTSMSIAKAIKQKISCGEVFVCGGGAHNSFLLQKLQEHLGTVFTVQTTNNFGIDPDWIEACCFAWLAKKRLENCPIDLSFITGAQKPSLLGGMYAP